MSSNRYLEIDSTYRDRTRFPQPASFEVPISINGRKSVYDAVDPVSKSAPIFCWTSNNLSTTTATVSTLVWTVAPETTRLSGTTDTSTFIIQSTSRLQQLDGYYVGLEIKDAAFQNRRRIKTYIFLGSYSSFDRAQITVDNSFPETFVPLNVLNVFDPTDLSNTSFPCFWVPDARIVENAYCSYILYNETINDYRKITGFNKITNILQLDTSYTGTPLTNNWGINDNYSIRKEIPYNPINLSSNFLVNSSTSNSVILNSSITGLGNIVNKFIRILPVVAYNYPQDNTTDNECRQIVSYDEMTNTINVFPSFSSPPPTNAPVEILNVSYDNLNPFNYTGSIFSQQQETCYEIELLSLILPTETLSVYNGGIITDYPFLYVEISNTCNGGNKNIIYSNNPNSSRALFRVPLFDIQDNPIFIKVNGGAIQTVKFKPNDALYFAVLMPNGEIFDTIIPEQFSPLEPEFKIQISAMFGIRKVIS